MAGGGGKGGESTTEVEIDKGLQKDAEELYSIGRDVAGLGYQPNRGVTIAGFTPQQKQAFQNTNSGLSAFGFGTVDPMAGLPEAQTNAQGISGYSTAPSYDEMVAGLPEEYRNSLDAIFDRIRNGEQRQGNSQQPQQAQQQGYVDPFQQTIDNAFGPLTRGK